MKDGACDNKHFTNTTSLSIDAVSNRINTMNLSSNNDATTEASTVILPGASTSDCKKVKGASKSKSNLDTLEVIGQLQNMSTADDNVSVCANCGKEGANNICNKCKQVKYCNAACKKKHRHKHKKDCEEHLRLVAEKRDKELFKQPPPLADCPICFLRLPYLDTGRRYMTCCGKEICSGCFYAPVYDDQGKKVDNEKCPFCRAPTPTSVEEAVKRLKKRVDFDDAIALHNQGNYCRDGRNGFPQDYTKAFELWHRAAELGYAKSYYSIGYAYSNGRGVKRDMKKAVHYWEQAAMEGNVMARYNLGYIEFHKGNMNRAAKHYMIAVGAGCDDSLKEIKELYSNGQATKEDYMTALRSYQEFLGEIKSKQRDEAAAADEEYRYY